MNDGKLIVQYRALPWELVESSIGYAPEPISTTDSPFGSKEEYANFLKDSHHYILLPVEAYSETYPTTQSLFNHLYENPELGDNEARLCIITRPTYDNSIDNNEHWALKTGSAGARYYFMLTGPEGATWEAHLNDKEGNFAFSTSNNDDFAACEDENFSKEVKMVTHGIAREQPYIIQIIATHLYTGYQPDMSGISDKNTEPRFDDGYKNLIPHPGETKNKWEEYFRDDYLTKWGENKWNTEEVVEAEFYITVKLADGAEHELTINPPYSPDKDEQEYFPFYNKETGTYHRFAGTETRIWIRQIRAQYDCPNLEYLAWDWNVDKGESDLNNNGSIDEWEKKSWWNKNPYWNPNHAWK